MESLKKKNNNPTLLAQAEKNLASLYHAWSRIENKSEYLGKAIELYRVVGRDCDMQRAAAYQENGQEGEATKIYSGMNLESKVEPNPDILMIQGNLALAKKNSELAHRVCDAWEKVPEASGRGIYAEARLRALNIYAYLILQKTGEEDKALAAYEEVRAFSEVCGVPLDDDSLHNLGVVMHRAALKVAESKNASSKGLKGSDSHV